jgi:VanZ family protein
LTSSRLRQLWIAAIVVLVAAIVAGSLFPVPELSIEHGADKYGHYLAYLVLALFSSGIVMPERLWRVMIRCFMLGLGLEAAQAFLTDTRMAEWADLLANAAGVVTAWIVAGGGRAGWAYRIAARYLEPR